MKEGLYDLLTNLAGSGLFRAWALVLLHSVWQGLLLHITAVFLLRYRKRMSASLMYNLLLLLFFYFPRSVRLYIGAPSANSAYRLDGGLVRSGYWCRIGFLLVALHHLGMADRLFDPLRPFCLGLNQ